MYVLLSCYKVQQFFKYCELTMMLANLKHVFKMTHVITFLKIRICFLLSRPCGSITEVFFKKIVHFVEAHTLPKEMIVFIFIFF